MNSLTLSLSLLVLTGTALAAEPPTPAPADPAPAPAAAEPKADDPLAEVLPTLRDNYLGFADLNVKPEDQLKDLVSRSKGELKLLDEVAKPVPIISTLLPGNIGYWRMASFTPEKTWDDLAAQLDQWGNQDVQGLILDLRGNYLTDESVDYGGAAQVAAFFARDHKAPFSMSGSISIVPEISVHPAHPFVGPMVVLTNQKTGSAAEALTGYLKNQGALVIGQPTGGNGAVYARKTLSTGQVLLYEIMTVTSSDGTQLWNHPVVPDISLKVNERSEKGALIEIKHNNVLDVIGESPDRHLMSEAALIQGIDPEWDAYLASLTKKPVLLSLPIIHDEALITALDSLKAIRVSQKGTETAAPDKIASKNTTSVQ